MRLKDADPEMFSEAWNRLPDSTRDNILEYLKSYPNLLEREYPLLLLHRAGKLSGDEVEELEEQATTERDRIESNREVEPKHPAQKKLSHQLPRSKTAGNRALVRPKSQLTSGDLAHRSTPRAIRAEGPKGSNGDSRIGGSQFLEELRKISKQNSIQIELLQRLLQAYEDQE